MSVSSECDDIENSPAIQELRNASVTPQARRCYTCRWQATEESDEILYITPLSKNATVPTRGSYGAAGFDLYSAYDYRIYPKSLKCIKTDLQMKPPTGTYLRVAPRSSYAWKYHLAVGAGVVDADFRGNVKVLLFNHSEDMVSIHAGDRIAQVICERISRPVVQVLEKLDETERGAGGWGSTDNKKKIFAYDVVG